MTTNPQTTNDLPKRLRIMAGMLAMCERIAFGSDSAIMDEAADEIERLNSTILLCSGSCKSSGDK